MSLIKITNSQLIELKDGTYGYKISCSGKQSDAVNLEPIKNYWFTQKNEDINSEIKGLFFGEVADPWELYGSDHNTVNIFYGLTKDIEKIESKLEDKVENLVNSFNKFDFENDLIMFSKWDFADETSLIILHLHNDLYDYTLEDLNLKKSNLITVVAGAETDDITLAEIVGGQVSKFLSKFKTGLEDSDEWEEIQEIMELGAEYAEENLRFNDSKLNHKSKELFLQMADHLFNNVVCFNDPSNEDNTNKIIAQKLIKYFQINKLLAPTDNEITELQFISDNSNKFYNVEFQIKNNEYIVNVYYGKTGATPNIMQKIKTTDLALAQKEYISAVTNQFAKGYNFNKPLKNMKLNNH